MPTLTLHPKTVATLPALDGKRTEYRDLAVPGLVLRVSPTGTRTWCVVYGRGRRHDAARMTLGALEERTLPEARTEARRILAAAAVGEDPAARAREVRRRPEGLTLADLARLYFVRKARQKRLRPKTEKEYRRLLDVEVLPQLGDRQPGSVTRADVRGLLATIEERSPSVANHTFEMIRGLYSWALSEDLVVSSPCVGMKKPAATEATDRVLSPPELRALLHALDDLESQSSDVVRVLLLTGVRLRMALGMRRDELQELEAAALARWVIAGGYGGRSKNRRAHVVPLSGPALAVVKRRLKAIGKRATFLFPNRDSAKRPAVWLTAYVERLRANTQRHFDADRKRRRLPPEAMPAWTVHQLRHTVRTHLREQLGVRDDVGELVLGHVRKGVAGTYNRAELLAERRAALVAWADWLERVKSDQPAKVLAHHPKA